MTPYSTGTWGSRRMVMAGGAVATRLPRAGRARQAIGAKLLQARSGGGRCCRTARFAASTAASPCRTSRTPGIAARRICRPTSIRGGLEVTAGYKPERDTGTFSYAAHAAVVAVDPELGDVEILDYVIVEDGGKLVNPMIVDGQIYGGLAQGIGTALYEEMPFDASGQPLASTLADYLLPGPTEVPAPRLDHMETPSPYTEFGLKGIGEGGAIAPPAAIANAVNDALRPLGVDAAVADHAAPRPRGDPGRAQTQKAPARMKPAPFDYARPRDLPTALAAARRRPKPSAKIMAGGQSLGPMLNLRLVQPELLVDITGLAELKQVERRGDELVLGACVTHADIEDGRVPDVTRGAMRARRRRHRLSRGAQSRHDRRQPHPCRSAADWVSALSALGAKLTLRSRAGERTIAVEDFIVGALERRCAPARSSKRSVSRRMPASARWGYYKICRKTGEFAHAIGAVLLDPERGDCPRRDRRDRSRADRHRRCAELFGGRIDGDSERFDARVADALLAKAGMLERVASPYPCHVAEARHPTRLRA